MKYSQGVYDGMNLMEERLDAWESGKILMPGEEDEDEPE